VPHRDIAPRPEDNLRSQQEVLVEMRLGQHGFATFHEPVTIHYRGRHYTPDFLAWTASAPRLIVEAKGTPEQAISEVRSEMLEADSPLWFVGDVFVLAAGDLPWICTSSMGAWRWCTLEPHGGFEVVDDEPPLDDVAGAISRLYGQRRPGF
jgi:hypothetical protein